MPGQIQAVFDEIIMQVTNSRDHLLQTLEKSVEEKRKFTDESRERADITLTDISSLEQQLINLQIYMVEQNYAEDNNQIESFRQLQEVAKDLSKQSRSEFLYGRVQSELQIENYKKQVVDLSKDFLTNLPQSSNFQSNPFVDETNNITFELDQSKIIPDLLEVEHPWMSMRLNYFNQDRVNPRLLQSEEVSFSDQRDPARRINSTISDQLDLEPQNLSNHFFYRSNQEPIMLDQSRELTLSDIDERQPVQLEQGADDSTHPTQQTINDSISSLSNNVNDRSYYNDL